MAHMDKIEIANKHIRSITYVGVWVNILLGILKTVIGFFGGSMALIYDGVHSFSDLYTDFAVLVGIRWGGQRPDAHHPYGHGRRETLIAGLIALVLVVVGGGMILKAAMSINAGEVASPRYFVLIVAAASIVSKEILYRFTRRVAIRTHSTMLYANAWHHRSDAASSVVVLAGVIASMFGFAYGDQIAAVAVGLMIIFIGLKVLLDCLREITESSADAATLSEIKAIIDSNNQVKGWHKLRSRVVGREVFMDLHILVDPELTINDAHRVSESLENAIHNQISQPINVTIHIEPDIAKLRKPEGKEIF